MQIKVLDHGYVRLVNSMGTEVDVANAARVSYDKEVFELSDNDKRLIRFLPCSTHCEFAVYGFR